MKRWRPEDRLQQTHIREGERRYEEEERWASDKREKGCENKVMIYFQKRAVKEEDEKRRFEMEKCYLAGKNSAWRKLMHIISMKTFKGFQCNCGSSSIVSALKQVLVRNIVTVNKNLKLKVWLYTHLKISFNYESHLAVNALLSYSNHILTCMHFSSKPVHNLCLTFAPWMTADQQWPQLDLWPQLPRDCYRCTTQCVCVFGAHAVVLLISTAHVIK